MIFLNNCASHSRYFRIVKSAEVKADGLTVIYVW